LPGGVGERQSVSRRQGAVISVHVVVAGESDLLELVLALQPRGRVPHFLHGRQQQADQDGDDRDHHQKLDESEAATTHDRDLESKHGGMHKIVYPTPRTVEPEEAVRERCLVTFQSA
jgi:hypothetical protein